MGEYRKRIFISGVLAVILVALLAGASYYLIPPETIPPPSPKPVPTATPPKPTPPLPSTPTPIPIPMPTVPPGPRIWVKVGVVSTEGFDYTMMGYDHPKEVLVLHQGTSGKIKIAIALRGNESHKVSLSFYVMGEWKDMEGVKCRFDPPTLDLKPKGEAESTLILKAASDAANGLYFPVISVYVEGLGEYQQSLGLPILVFPRTPAYIFTVVEGRYPTPPTPPTPETTVTPPPTPLPFPTPAPTPPPPKPYIPEIEVEKGREIYLIFYIEHPVVMRNPKLTLNLTYEAGTLPKGINVEITYNPLKVVQNPSIESSILVTLKADPEAKEGNYRIVARGSVDGITYERVFNLKVVK